MITGSASEPGNGILFEPSLRDVAIATSSDLDSEVLAAITATRSRGKRNAKTYIERMSFQRSGLYRLRIAGVNAAETLH